jgi:hypothetical protein
MVWCRAGLRGGFISVYTDFFLRATNLRKPIKPACTIPCVIHRQFFNFYYNSLLRLCQSISFEIYQAHQYLDDGQILQTI